MTSPIGFVDSLSEALAVTTLLSAARSDHFRMRRCNSDWI